MPKAKNLKYCRKKEHLTQAQLAEQLGVTRATVASWESKKHAITEPNARRISNFFGVDYDDFCDEDFEKINSDLMHGKLTLTKGEVKSIKTFRMLPPEVKAVIRNAIEFAYNASIEQGDKQHEMS